MRFLGLRGRLGVGVEAILGGGCFFVFFLSGVFVLGCEVFHDVFPCRGAGDRM